MVTVQPCVGLLDVAAGIDPVESGAQRLRTCVSGRYAVPQDGVGRGVLRCVRAIGQSLRLLDRCRCAAIAPDLINQASSQPKSPKIDGLDQPLLDQ